MQLGMIGLGRMGGNIVRRLIGHGHQCVVYDRNEQAVAALAADRRRRRCIRSRNSSPSSSRPRAVWVMLPAGQITEETIDHARPACCRRGDIVIDGGNTFYKDDIRRAKELAAQAASAMSTSAPRAASGGSSAAIA